MKKSANEGERGIKEWEKAVLWIWIRIRFHFGRLDPDPDSGGPKLPTEVKKIHVLKCQLDNLC